MFALDESIDDGEGGHHMARGATTGDGGEDRHRGRRATFIKRPAAAIDAMSELPPNEMNGKVRPVTGSNPMTPPMLIEIWTMNQQPIPAATRKPKRWRQDKAT